MPSGKQNTKDYFCFEKSCKFIGSLAITLLNGNERQAFVNEKLLEMKDVGKGVPVVFLVSDEGIKILKDDKSAVKMAHGITRVLFSTSHPDKRLFAYVVSVPGPNRKVVTQAHMFKTSKSKHTQELSSSIARSFKIAYSRNTIKRRNRVDLFEQEAADNKEKINVRKKRWAKGELAHGHDNASHALRAKGFGSANNRPLEKPSGGVQKLVASLEKEKKEQKQISREVAISPDAGFQRSNDSNKHFDKNANHKEVWMLSKNEAAPKSDQAPTYENTRILHHEKQNKDLFSSELLSSDEERKISRGSTSLDDWDIVRTGVSDAYPSSNRFAAPAPRFGSVTEDLSYPAKLTDNVMKPISKFGILPENSVNPVNEEEEERKPAEFVEEALYLNVQGAEIEDSSPSNAKKISNSQCRKKKKNPTSSANRMTLTEEQILKNSEWYQPGFSRNIAEEILQNHPIGSFFIRDSSSHPGSYVMTMRVLPDVKSTQSMNYLIVMDQDGLYRIKGFTNVFPALTYLVAHYSSVDEDLPCRLYLSIDNPLYRMENEGKIDMMDGEESLDFLLDEDVEEQDQDYINFSSNFDICKELDELCFL